MVRLSIARRKLQCEKLEQRQLLVGDLLISEFLPHNTAYQADEDGDHSDWVEIFNNSQSAAELAGWSLTDNVDLPSKWTFPQGVILQPGEFLVVFASGKDRRVANEPLHTSFALQDENGYLALVDDGSNAVHEFAYAETFADIPIGIPMPDTPVKDPDVLLPVADTWLRESRPNSTWEDDGMWVAHELIFRENRWGVAEWDLSHVDAEIVSAHMEFNPRTRADANAVQVAFSIAPGIEGLTWNEYQSSKLGTEQAFDSLGGVTVPSSGLPFGSYFAGTAASHDDLVTLNSLRETTGKLAVAFKAQRGAVEWNDGANPGGPGFAADLPIRLVLELDVPFTPIEIGDVAATNPTHLIPATPGEFNVGSGADGLEDGIVISEIMASNGGSLRDEDGSAPDWIEIYNASEADVDLSGWHLTDDEESLGKWTFPEGTQLARGEQLLVFASDKDRAVAGGELHTNFKLSSRGEYLAIVDDQQQIRHAFNFSQQQRDVSFGIAFPDFGEYSPPPSVPLNPTNVGFFIDATPRSGNGASLVQGFTAAPTFSVDHGFFEAGSGFELSFATETENAVIYYTLDGSRPDPSFETSILFATNEPPRIERTSVVRAAAFREGYQASPVETRSYVFPSDVILQSPEGETPSGVWPDGNVAGQVFDYGMDPDIVNDPVWGPQLVDALTSISTFSIVTDMVNLIHPSTGIYVNAGGQGRDWERPTSVELIHPDGTTGFQIDAGIRPRGNFSANPGNPKHAFRLFFREEYGEASLNYPLFGAEGVDEFRKLDLRTAQNDSWAFQASDEMTFVHDVFSRDNQGQMGQPYTRSRYHHLYINGVYWGIFQSQERAEANFGASYLGGDADDYDTIKSTGGPQYRTEATDGNFDAWRQLWNELKAGVADDADYMRLQGLNLDGTPNPDYPVLLDVDNLIDYMLDIMYTGDEDRGLSVPLGNNSPNNFFAIRNRNGRHGFQFFSQDAEQSMLSNHNVAGLAADRVGPFTGSNRFSFPHSNPQWFHQDLLANQQYRWRFQDRVHELFYNGGMFTPEASTNRFLERASQIETAIIAESARWGDAHNSRRGNPFTKDDWQRAVDRIVNVFFSQRSDIVLGQFRAARRESPDGLVDAPLYPHTNAPVFEPHGGQVDEGYQLIITDPGIISETDTPLVNAETTAKVLVPTSNDLGLDWIQPDFADDDWRDGLAAVGFERAARGTNDYTDLIGTDVGEEMFELQTSVYVRIQFDVTDADTIDKLILRMKYDDGFVAYLDGTEIVRSETVSPGPVEFDSRSRAHPDRQALAFEDFDISRAIPNLQVGQHVLAIHGLNSSRTGNDMLMVPELVIRNQQNTPGGGTVYYTLDGTDPRHYDPLTGETQIASSARSLDGNPLPVLSSSAMVNARVLNNDEWSALNRARFVVIARDILQPDFNSDGKIDVRDIDLLAAGIRANDATFDLNQDGEVDRSDMVVMIHDVLGTQIGDANLDGRFDSSDLVQIFQASEYEDDTEGNSNWSAGDWNADGEFDSGDLVFAFEAGTFVLSTGFATGFTSTPHRFSGPLTGRAN